VALVGAEVRLAQVQPGVRSERFVRGQQTLELALQRNLERIRALAAAVLAACRRLGRQRRGLGAGLRARDCERPRQRGLGAPLGRVARGRETPRAADACTHPDTLVLIAVQFVDLAVTGRHEL